MYICLSERCVIISVHTETFTFINTFIYICMCRGIRMCVCVCVRAAHALVCAQLSICCHTGQGIWPSGGR